VKFIANIKMEIKDCDNCPFAEVKKVYTSNPFEDARKIYCKN